MNVVEANRAWQGRYGITIAIVLLALSPNTILTTAYPALLPALAADLRTTELSLQVAEGLSNAGIAAGAVVAAFLGQRYVQRYLFLGYQSLFVLGSVLAAAAPSLGVFAAGRVMQGTTTGFMVISALPVLVTRFGVGRLPVSVLIVNIGLFGSTTLGPLVGGAVAATGTWRMLFWLMVAAGVVGLVTAALGYERFGPVAPGLRLDKTAIALTFLATFLPFYATAALPGSGFTSAYFLVPFVVGLAALVLLVAFEYRAEDPLVPVKALSTQLPVTGTIVAMVGGAVFVTALSLAQLFLSDVARVDPLRAGTLFWPMPVGLLVAAVVFALVFRTRWLPLLVDVGLVALGLGVALLLLADARSFDVQVQTASAALGFGAGATVSPGLFLAAMGVPSGRLGRAFALVMLLRAEAAYAIAPIVLYVAGGWSSLAAGISAGLVCVLVLAVAGLVVALVVPAVSGARLREPDLEAWLERGEAALPSPTTAVHARPGKEDETAAPLVPSRRSR
jgi:MFS family permease